MSETPPLYIPIYVYTMASLTINNIFILAVCLSNRETIVESLRESAVSCTVSNQSKMIQCVTLRLAYGYIAYL
jgi:hypothetical protein